MDEMCKQIPELMEFANAVMHDGSVLMQADVYLFGDDPIAIAEVPEFRVGWS